MTERFWPGVPVRCGLKSLPGLSFLILRPQNMDTMLVSVTARDGGPRGQRRALWSTAGPFSGPVLNTSSHGLGS